MKINSNVLAATILGASIIVAAAVYACAPQSGRFIFKETQDDVSYDRWVFDSATGTRYSYHRIGTIGHEPIIVWNVFKTDDYVKSANEHQEAVK